MTTSDPCFVETLGRCFLSPEEILQRFGWVNGEVERSCPGLGPQPWSVADHESGNTHRGGGKVRRRNVDTMRLHL